MILSISKNAKLFEIVVKQESISYSKTNYDKTTKKENWDYNVLLVLITF